MIKMVDSPKKDFHVSRGRVTAIHVSECCYTYTYCILQ